LQPQCNPGALQVQAAKAPFAGRVAGRGQHAFMHEFHDAFSLCLAGAAQVVQAQAGLLFQDQAGHFCHRERGCHDFPPSLARGLKLLNCLAMPW
jgi:hypothetical protein